MIFVVEPVAIPNRYLAQHYFGVPWLPERRTNPVQSNPALETIAATLQYLTEPTVLQRKDSEVSQNKSQGNFYNMNRSVPSYPFLLSNYSEKPLSLQAAHSKSPVTVTKLNRTTAHHWHHWSPPTVIRQIPKEIISNGTVRWSSLISKNGQIIRNEAKSWTTGSVKSVHRSELAH
ncbi:hypothetical protein HNY73_005469 [Argiope bruennichi]|uniref:Uncharacterized protein n=1 Tax=Argiope bruennichi TaxID=94029 RepID=A0A8T0FM20_ARGBR|nr:hypothetical protein HNY73_005469 [Argiope bruennichi]